MAKSNRYVQRARAIGRTVGKAVRFARVVYPYARAAYAYMSKKKAGRRVQVKAPFRVRQTMDTSRRGAYGGGIMQYGRNRGGKYYGRFKRPTKKKFNVNKNIYGVVTKLENGGTVSTTMANTIYVGHGPAISNMCLDFYLSIIKYLAVKAGINIKDFREPIGQTLAPRAIDRWLAIAVDLRVGVKPTNSVSRTVARVHYLQAGVPNVATTWDSFATQLGSAVDTLMGSPPFDQVDETTLLSFVLTEDEFGLPDGSGVKVTLATLDATSAFIDVDYSSTLVVQNRTNDAANATNVESTSNNPLHGKLYESNKWLNGFEGPKSVTSLPLGSKSLIAYAGSGAIIAQSTTTNPTTLQKVPQAWALGCKKESKVHLQPGAIKKVSHTWRASMSLNTYFSKMFKPMLIFNSLVGSDQIRVPIGRAQLLGLECQLWDRVETTQLQVSWELNQTYGTVIKSRMTPTLPIIALNSTAINA